MRLFVNLPVDDLPRTIAFFTGLGFEFNPKFTDENATCMIIGEDAHAMLLTKDRFKDFTNKPLADVTAATGAILALSVESREAVDQFAEKALATGATPAMPPIDLGFMYSRSFYDPSGHHWEVFYMDPVAAAGGPPPA